MFSCSGQTVAFMIEPPQRVRVAVDLDTSREVLLDCVRTRVGSVATGTMVLEVL